MAKEARKSNKPGNIQFEFNKLLRETAYKAYQEGNIIEFFKEYDWMVNEPIYNKCTALYLAATAGDKKLVQELLELKNIDVDKGCLLPMKPEFSIDELAHNIYIGDDVYTGDNEDARKEMVRLARDMFISEIDPTTELSVTYMWSSAICVSTALLWEIHPLLTAQSQVRMNIGR